MMKKMYRLMTLLLALCLAMPTAMADVLPLPEEEWSGIYYMAVAGDTLYLTTQIGAELHLWRWTPDMQQAERLPIELRDGMYTAGIEQVPILSAMFSGDDGTLYGLDHYGGTVYAIDTEGDMSCTPVQSINVEPLLTSGGDLRSYAKPQSAMVVGDHLIWHTRRGAVIVYDLTTGNAKRCVTDAYAVCPYKDGKVLLLRQVNGVRVTESGAMYHYSAGYALSTYDPKTDAIEHLTGTQIEQAYTPIAYHAGWDMVVYQDDTRLMGVTSQGETQQVGFVPYRGLAEITLQGDTLLRLNYSSILACDLMQDFRTAHELNIIDGLASDVSERFIQENPEVPFYFISVNDVDGGYRGALTQEEHAADLVSFRVTADQEDFYDLAAEGMLMDLSADSALKAYVDELYPAYRDAVTLDGGIYGILVEAKGYGGWFINRAVMAAMGLTEADIPTNLNDLCAFITRWNEEWADAYPQYTLLDSTENYRERMLGILVEMWALHCQQSGTPVNYDAPAFRELLASLDAMETKNLDANQRRTETAISDYKQALLWTDCCNVGEYLSYMDEDTDRIFLPMTVTAEAEYAAPVTQMQVWAVNAASPNAEYALQVLTDKIAALSERAAYTLLSTQTEPVKDEYWAGEIDRLEKEIADLEETRTDSVSPDAIDTQITLRQQEMADITAHLLYSTSPATIRHYAEVIAPALVIRRADGVNRRNDAPAYEEMQAYLGGEWDADAFIEGLNALAAQ